MTLPPGAHRLDPVDLVVFDDIQCGHYGGDASASIHRLQAAGMIDRWCRPQYVPTFAPLDAPTWDV